jgi:hypothetical protein
LTNIRCITFARNKKERATIFTIKKNKKHVWVCM